MDGAHPPGAAPPGPGAAAQLHTARALVEPRAAHRLEPGPLLNYLRTAVPGLAGEAGPLRVRAFSHGQSNPTYLLELGGGRRLVLRKKPPGRLLASAHAVEREYAVLAALAAGGAVPVPRPLALCEDAGVLGTPFYVMEFAEGTIFTAPGMPAAGPAARAAAYAGLADTLAALHGVDPAAAGLGGLGEPARYCERQVRRWARQHAASVAGPPCPKVARLTAWLSANVPAEDAAPRVPAIVHGDFRLDNLVFDAQTRVRGGGGGRPWGRAGRDGGLRRAAGAVHVASGGTRGRAALTPHPSNPLCPLCAAAGDRGARLGAVHAGQPLGRRRVRVPRLPHAP
jgi:aminoglycoside phosphotransferase (APT) family kinase protein